jgi:hypothetical protein
MPTPNLRFNHRVHVERKVDCKVCHEDMDEVVLATRNQLPKMSTCLKCHDGSQASAECKTCHLESAPGRLRLAFASALLRPIQGNPFGMDHGPRFDVNHGTRAKLARETCMQCHAMNECQSCHDSLQKPLSIHPNDYITIHPVQARSQTTQCQSCHRMQSFCVACHERVGLGQTSDPALRPRNVRVHPDYATWVTERSPRHHAFAASRDIQQCISCHREESCMACHAETVPIRSGPYNPHPSGFRSQCRAVAARNYRASLKCQQETFHAQEGCR